MMEQTKQPGFIEFVALIALIISLVALSIDAMLPALPNIAADLGVTRINDSQFVISVLFVGLALGQIIFGPLSDYTGRKVAINIGFGIFIIGCLISFFAQDFSHMLAGRFLQGLGAAGPRVVAVALVRDRYHGRDMARVMSFVMTIFILVPVIAPTLGQLILSYASWRAIFGVFLLLVVIVSAWFSLRQPETLPVEKRVQFSPKKLLASALGIVSIPATIGYTLTMGMIFGAFVGYLSSSQQIFQKQYALESQFAIYFGVLAASIGAASLLNAKLVMHFGMRRLSFSAMVIIVVLSVPFYPLAAYYQGHPPLMLLMAYLLLVFFCMGLLFGNLNALAMEPLGKVAGLGAAVVGSSSTIISVILGMLVSDAYDGTVLPLVSGFAALGIACLLCIYWTERLALLSVVSAPDS